jgi:hypothetical protein
MKESNMERLTILDFTTGDVDIYPIEYDYEPDMEELLEELGHNANNCQWMFGDSKVTIHNEVLKQ